MTNRKNRSGLRTYMASGIVTSDDWIKTNKRSSVTESNHQNDQDSQRIQSECKVSSEYSGHAFNIYLELVRLTMILHWFNCRVIRMETVLDSIITRDLSVYHEGNYSTNSKTIIGTSSLIQICLRIDYLRTKDQCYITGWGYTGQGSADVSNTLRIEEVTRRTLI